MRFLPALLLAACPLPETDTGKAAPNEETPTRDRETDPPDTHVSDVDTDLDTDADVDCDTGLAAAYWIGAFEADGADYVSARFGVGYYGMVERDWVCRLEGDLPYEGGLGCPDCTWAWDLGGLTDTVAVGDACDDFGLFDGAWGGYFDYAWAFADSYVYDYNGTPLYLEDNILLDVGDGWVVFAFTLPLYGIYQTYGDASHVTAYRPSAYGSFYPYYLDGC
ncbi:MAG: hypothetical protein ACOZNI_26500 [Myxococcota bacterium]